MWATFECNSTIQLWLTPQRDLSVFFCYIYLLVQGCLQLSGLITVYTAFWIKWEYMHWLIIALLLLVMIATMILFRNYRSMPKLPLFGIDWLGALMWGIVILCIIFVCVYGEHYDWYRDYMAAMRKYSGVKTMQIVGEIRYADAKSKGVQNSSMTDGDILRELVFKILH